MNGKSTRYTRFGGELRKTGQVPTATRHQLAEQRSAVGIGRNVRRLDVEYGPNTTTASIPKATRRRLEDACWLFHEAVIEQLGVKAILCMGGDAYEAVRRRYGVTEEVDALPNGWRPPKWHRAYATQGGMLIFKLTHPSRWQWQVPQHNPAPLVRRVLELDR